MPFCSGCGAKNDGQKFCGECGKPVEAAPATGVEGAAKEYEANLPKNYTTDKSKDGVHQVTDAVRGYAAGASNKEKEAKYGQQKWGLFETNSQRVEGITTEQSLQRIENAMAGKFEGQSTSSGSSGSHTAGFGSKSGGGSSDAMFGTAGANGGAGGNFGSKTAGGSSTTTHKAPIDRNLGFGAKGANASSFLAGYNQKQAAKFKPKGDLGM